MHLRAPNCTLQETEGTPNSGDFVAFFVCESFILALKSPAALGIRQIRAIENARLSWPHSSEHEVRPTVAGE
jgi:hypothetical protein